MVTYDGVTRRRLLQGMAVTAGSVALVSCSSGSGGSGDSGSGDDTKPGKAGSSAKKGSETKPLAPPASFHEAPMLASQVKAGKLPPIDKRLPQKPYVVPHRWLETGKFGGSVNMIMSASDDGGMKEYMYGRSFLRYLNDGLNIGPGLAESWEHNSDQSEWTFHFRQGLKWSDGVDWTTDDIMYWWVDMVQNTQHPEVPPDDVRSGKDTVAKVTAPDKYTLKLTFDAPAPATAERIAAWVNGPGLGPLWFAPKHYIKQFHPKYNKSIKRDDWYIVHDQKDNWQLNPDCPVMTGWRVKKYDEGRTTIWERNPYYYVVDKAGNQLPYLDQLNFTIVKDPQANRLKIMQGTLDYVHGGHTALTIADIAPLQDNQKKSGLKLRLWDSGSGTGSILFWNQDYKDEKTRTLFRDKRFRRALSAALNRTEMRKAIYFNTGEETTGTLSPKGTIFAESDEAHKHYVQWRDAYVKYDVAGAKKILDDMGLKDSDGDGFREYPDGKPIEIFLDYPADTSQEHIEKNNSVKKYWEAVGIKTTLDPVPPDSFASRWARGDLMTTTAWEVGDNQVLVYPGWVIPVVPDHWAPLHGQAFVMQTGAPDKLKSQAKLSPWKRTPPWVLPEKGDPIDRLWKLYARARVEADVTKRTQLLWEVCKIHVDEGPYFLGVIANYPRIVLVRDGLKNVAFKENLALGGWVNPWIQPSPGVYDPEAYFWDDPSSHKITA